MAAASPPYQTDLIDTLMSRVARATAALVAVACVCVLAGYALNVDALVRLRADWPGTSPLTAVAILVLAVLIAVDKGHRSRLGWLPVLVGVYALLAHAMAGRDDLSRFVAAHVFSLDADHAGRIAIPTAICLVALGVADLGRRRPKLADRLAALAIVISAFAVLNELYETGTLRSLALFATMGLQTAVAILLVSFASLAVRPRVGWASVVASRGTGGASTRRVIAFTLLPPLLGLLLARTAELHRLNFGAAMAALVVMTVAPLALLVLRSGRILDELDREREAAAATGRRARASCSLSPMRCPR